MSKSSHFHGEAGIFQISVVQKLSQIVHSKTPMLDQDISQKKTLFHFYGNHKEHLFLCYISIVKDAI